MLNHGMPVRLADKLRAAFGCFDDRDLAGAERLCGEVLAQAPRNPDALHLLGVIRLAGGNAGAAADYIGRALKANPHNATMLEHLGVACLTLQNHRQAEAAFRQALQYGAAHGLLHMRLGLALGSQGKLAEAEGALRNALQQAPQDPDVHLNLGNLLAEREREEEALACYHRALALQPDHIEARYNLATLLKALGRSEEALAAYDSVLELAPDYADAHNNLGTVYEQMGQPDKAIECYRKVLTLDPASAHAHSNLGSALRAQGLLDPAKQHCEKALAIAPRFADALLNLGNILVDQGLFAEALHHYGQALEADPRNAHVQLAHGVLCLGMADFSRGWQGYQWRPTRALALAERGALDAALPPDVAARTLLLLGEQGIGDELFFLRFAPALHKRGARLVCQCNPGIKALIRRTGYFDHIVSHGQPTPQTDKTLLLGDLPQLMLGKTPLFPDDQPAPGAGSEGQSGKPRASFVPPLRLQVLQERVMAMRQRLACLGPPPYVGLTWRAGTPPALQRLRGQSLHKEVPLEMISPVFNGFSATLLALQRQPRAGELATLERGVNRTVHDLSDVNEGLEDMLALLSLIAEYVGVSNTNMHLMAGLGGKARVLVPRPAEWRWMVRGDASPWFPGFAVYRQDSAGDWAPALARLGADLRRSLP